MRRVASSLLSFLLAACASPSAEEVAPAVLIPNAQAHAALTQAIATALESRPVTLTDDALTHSSRLLIEPARPRGSDGRLLQGRELRAPEAFRLLKHGNDCVLVHERTRKEFVLQDTRCVPEGEKGE